MLNWKWDPPFELAVQGSSTRSSIDTIIQVLELIADLEATCDEVGIISCVHVELITASEIIR